MHKFHAILEIIGVNPFVFVPEDILQKIFSNAKKDKGHIPIYNTINKKKYKQAQKNLKNQPEFLFPPNGQQALRHLSVARPRK